MNQLRYFDFAIHPLPPNQRLKLTEPAVDDFAARNTKETEMNNCHVRATFYTELTARCRSLAAVR